MFLPHPCQRTILAAAAVLGLIVTAATARGQGDANWSDAFDHPGLTGRVFSLGTYGTDLIAGGYTSFPTDGDDIPYVARLDGDRWVRLGQGVSGSVRAIQQHGGDLYVAGEFDSPGHGVARWDGSQWLALGQGLELSFGTPEIFALAVYQGDLYAGGLFDSAGGQPIATIARWDGSQWHPVGGLSDHDGHVWTLQVHDQKLYVGGEFSALVDGHQLDNLAVWDGTSWSDVGGGVPGPANLAVTCLASFQGDLYVGGNFSQVGGGVAADRAAYWDGAQWHDLAGGLPDWDIGVTVYALQPHDQMLYVGGNFIEAGTGTDAYRVAAWDGATWHGLGGVYGADTATTVIAATVHDGRLVVGGEFSLAGGATGTELDDYVVSQSVAAFTGTDWIHLGDGLGLNVEAETAVAYDGGLVVVGRFTEAGTAAVASVAFFDGASWTEMGLFDDKVNDAVVFQGDLVVTGRFDHVDGQPIGSVARYDGTQWHAMADGAGGRSLGVYQDQLYAGGLGEPRRWNGTSWETFADVDIFGNIETFHVHDGVLYIGGTINQFGGPGPNLLAWDGTHVTEVGGGGPDEMVEAMASFQGDLIVGGRFDTVAGVPAESIARWDGTQWTEFGDGLGNSVLALAVYDDQTLFAGGDFNSATGDPEYMARWDGAAWQPLGSGLLGAPLGLYADSANGFLYVPGLFNRAGGKPAFNFARWTVEEVTATPDVPGPVALELRVAPNPFNPRTTLRYELPAGGHVRLDVYDLRGRAVVTLVDGQRTAGAHTVEWTGRDADGRRLASGVYLARLATGGATTTRKLVLAQ